MSTDQITLRLSDSEALVFFEFLARFCNDRKLAIEHKSEEQVLNNILSMMESTLAAPFASDYSEQLDKARAELSHQ